MLKKHVTIESKKLRDSARGQQCTIRLPGVCNSNQETTVLCHLPGAGMGMKSSDVHAAFGCSACHDEVDRRTRNVLRDVAMLAFFYGMVRTQQYWIDEGYLTAGDRKRFSVASNTR